MMPSNKIQHEVYSQVVTVISILLLTIIRKKICQSFKGNYFEGHSHANDNYIHIHISHIKDIQLWAFLL